MGQDRDKSKEDGRRVKLPVLLSIVAVPDPLTVIAPVNELLEPEKVVAISVPGLKVQSLTMVIASPEPLPMVPPLPVIIPVLKLSAL